MVYSHNYMKFIHYKASRRVSLGSISRKGEC